MKKSERGTTAEQFDCVFKIVLTGDSGVGKSNILLRYIKDVFSRTSPTIGVEFAIKAITLEGGKKIKAQIWDTSGCERYRAITTGHYRRAEGALLVYDVTNKDTFASLEYWIKELKNHTDKHLVIALIGNKVDVLFTDPKKREVSKERAVQFAKEQNLLFTGESSALADINIKEIIELLVQRIYEVQTDLVSKGEKDAQSLKLTYEEERHRRLGGGCC